MQSISRTGLGARGNKQLMMVERSSEVALGERGRRHRRAAVRGPEKACQDEMQEDVVVKRELPCKMEEEVEFGQGGSKDKDMHLAKEGGEETLWQDSYKDKTAIESNHKQEDSAKDGGVMLKSNQPLLLHRAPRFSHS